MDFLTRPSNDSTGTGARTFRVDVPKNVGGQRQGRFQLEGFVGVPNTGTHVRTVALYSSIDQSPLIVPVPSAPSYLYYAAPYPSWEGVTRVMRDGVDATLQVVGIGESGINVVVRSLGNGGSSDFLRVSFGAPNGQTLHVGTYDNALRFPSDTSGGIDFGVGSLGCNQTFGRFSVEDILITGHAPSGGGTAVGRFRATFEVSCESPTVPPTVGEVWYVAR